MAWFARIISGFPKIHSLRIYPYPLVWPLPRPWSETMVSTPFRAQKTLEIKGFLGLERPFLDLVLQTPRPRDRGRPLFAQECPARHLDASRQKLTPTVLSGPVLRDTAILSLRYPISRDTFSEGGGHSPKIVRYPPLLLSFTQAHQCDTLFCNVLRDNVRYPMKKNTQGFCDTIATSIARYEKYRYWASWPLSRGNFWLAITLTQSVS